MTAPPPRPWFTLFADPVQAAIFGVFAAGSGFVVRGERRGFPVSRAELTDAALFALLELSVPLVLCFLYRLVRARRARRDAEG